MPGPTFGCPIEDERRWARVDVKDKVLVKPPIGLEPFYRGTQSFLGP